MLSPDSRVTKQGGTEKVPQKESGGNHDPPGRKCNPKGRECGLKGQKCNSKGRSRFLAGQVRHSYKEFDALARVWAMCA